MKTLGSPLLILTLLCLAASPCAHARTIAWGSELDSILVDSNGVTLDASHTFELGTFGTFVPTSINIDLWLTNWKAFDRATVPIGFNPSEGWVSSAATLEADMTSSRSDLPQHTFTVGEQAYIMVYDSLALSDPATELALITDASWLMPTSDTHSPDTRDWRINAAGTAVFGGLNNIQGPGQYGVNPNAFVLQTHNSPSPIPEPGSALLLTSLGLMFRRRRA
jgi:hypothetical protein